MPIYTAKKGSNTDQVIQSFLNSTSKDFSDNQLDKFKAFLVKQGFTDSIRNTILEIVMNNSIDLDNYYLFIPFILQKLSTVYPQHICNQNTLQLYIEFAYPKFHLKHLRDPFLRNYEYWVAHYYVNKPQSSRSWTIWQFTDKGIIPGIRQKVDINVIKGGEEKLRELQIK